MPSKVSDFIITPTGVGAPDYTTPVSTALSSAGSKTPTVILNKASIPAAPAPGCITNLGDCLPIDLSSKPSTLTITVEATYHASATRGIIIHVRSATDNLIYDTEDYDTFTLNFRAGATIRQTIPYDPSPYGLKILVENLDTLRVVSAVKVYVTLG